MLWRSHAGRNTWRSFGAEVGFVQHGCDRVLNLLNSVSYHLLLQGTDTRFHFAERDLPHRNSLIDVKRTGIGKQFGNSPAFRLNTDS